MIFLHGTIYALDSDFVVVDYDGGFWKIFVYNTVSNYDTCIVYIFIIYRYIIIIK